MQVNQRPLLELQRHEIAFILNEVLPCLEEKWQVAISKTCKLWQSILVSIMHKIDQMRFHRFENIFISRLNYSPNPFNALQKVGEISENTTLQELKIGQLIRFAKVHLVVDRILSLIWIDQSQDFIQNCVKSDPYYGRFLNGRTPKDLLIASTDQHPELHCIFESPLYSPKEKHLAKYAAASNLKAFFKNFEVSLLEKDALKEFDCLAEVYFKNFKIRNPFIDKVNSITKWMESIKVKTLQEIGEEMLKLERYAELLYLSVFFENANEYYSLAYKALLKEDLLSFRCKLECLHRVYESYDPSTLSHKGLVMVQKLLWSGQSSLAEHVIFWMKVSTQASDDMHAIKMAVTILFNAYLNAQKYEKAFDFRQALINDKLDRLQIDALFLEAALSTKHIFLVKFLWDKHEHAFSKIKELPMELITNACKDAMSNLQKAAEHFLYLITLEMMSAEKQPRKPTQFLKAPVRPNREIPLKTQVNAIQPFPCQTFATPLHQELIDRASQKQHVEDEMALIEANELNETVLHTIQQLILQGNFVQAILNCNSLLHIKPHELNGLLDNMFKTVPAGDAIFVLLEAIAQLGAPDLQLQVVDKLYARLMQLNWKKEALGALCVINDPAVRQERLSLILIYVFKLPAEDAEMYIKCTASIADFKECFDSLCDLLGL